MIQITFCQIWVLTHHLCQILQAICHQSLFYIERDTEIGTSVRIDLEYYPAFCPFLNLSHTCTFLHIITCQCHHKRKRVLGYFLKSRIRKFVLLLHSHKFLLLSYQEAFTFPQGDKCHTQGIEVSLSGHHWRKALHLHIHFRSSIDYRTSFLYKLATLVINHISFNIQHHGYTEIRQDQVFMFLVHIQEVARLYVPMQDMMAMTEVYSDCHFQSNTLKLVFLSLKAYLSQRATFTILHHLKVMCPTRFRVCPQAMGINANERAVCSSCLSHNLFQHIMIRMAIRLIYLQYEKFVFSLYQIDKSFA